VDYWATADEVLSHLQNAVQMLQDHDNYRIALLDADEANEIFVQPFWEVTGTESVLIQTRLDGEEGEEADLGIKITEKNIVKTFQVYFKSLWEGVSSDHREKDWVIWWLERQIDELGK
jgi:hypothetical protein